LIDAARHFRIGREWVTLRNENGCSRLAVSAGSGKVMMRRKTGWMISPVLLIAHRTIA